MLILFVIFFIFLLNVRISVLQKNVARLEATYNNYTCIKNLDPETLTMFNKLKLLEKHKLFDSCSISINLFEVLEQEYISPFELFWRACHEQETFGSAKYFQDALLLMSQKAQEQVKVSLIDLQKPEAELNDAKDVKDVKIEEDKDEEEDEKKVKKPKTLKNKHVE